MNFFGQNFTDQVMGLMGNKNTEDTQNINILRSQLETCTYRDETKFQIQRSVKNVFHVYPFFKTDILMFQQGGMQRRYLELKGLLEIDVKGKTCKIDFNMMLPNDYPRTPPYVRIVNRNLDYKVDPFYQQLKSKNDPSSYILNEKLNSVRNWGPASNLVNVVIECYDILKNKFPFAKPHQEVPMYGATNNAWNALYQKPTQNQGANQGANYGGGGFNSNSWGNNNANNAWGSNNQGWGQGTQGWGGGQGTQGWGGQGGMGGGMGGIIGGVATSGGGMGGGGAYGANQTTSSIAKAQAFVGKTKKSLQILSADHRKILQKSQTLDLTKKSIQSEEQYLRMQSYTISQFLRQTQNKQVPNILSMVSTSNEYSQQVLDTVCSLKAREDCLQFLQGKFCGEEMSLDTFLKNLRKIQQGRFEEKVLLKKCLKNKG